MVQTKHLGMHPFTNNAGAKHEIFRETVGEGGCGPLSRPKLLDGEPLSARLRWYPHPARLCSRRELIADRCVNFLGSGLAWPAAIAISYFASASGAKPSVQYGIWAFGAGIVAMFNISAYNHYCCWEQARSWTLGSLDHIGIDAAIVGTYAPICIRSNCYGLLAFTVAISGLGMILEAYRVGPGKHILASRYRQSYQVSLCGRYLVMGWSIVAVFPHVKSVLPASAIRSFCSGGVCVTVGVLFFLRSSLEFHKVIWHVSVLLSMSCFYAGIIQMLVVG
eukprot:TRINITY_DN45753_c0_g1_i1.p1 TRINITY_DN45753_c0_g1~~TRINITY_DN45753_c0_g1_i1.p1  ORF type:complete len:278 (+),score=4.07 TRINITY_DN45753_c0_g1_i1:198-1031(+)